MRVQTTLNDRWQFHAEYRDSLLSQARPGKEVTLPHNAVDLPLNYFDEGCYQRRIVYQRLLDWRPEFEGRRISLQFDGAMADATVYLNGGELKRHRDGYTPFEVALDGLRKESANLLAIRLDGTENPEIPPFGGLIDYLTYAGIYRDVWLRSTCMSWIQRIKVEVRNPLSDSRDIRVMCEIANPVPGAVIDVRITNCEGHELALATSDSVSKQMIMDITGVEGLSLWDLDSPTIYTASVTLRFPGGSDQLQTRFGCRLAEFKEDGFFLNGRNLKLRGLNRHQSYPYVGYAMGRRAQEEDAEILKFDLKCNIVRTSHYPQSPWFLDHCDRIGLLVFEEIPGWQHIGGDSWKEETLRNVRRMIERDWNHPSIVAWGVRINESGDDTELYSQTNALARKLDPTRQTSGVRCIEDSEMLEDVYAMNDFVQGMEEQPWVNHPPMVIRDQQTVTGLDRKVPYIITEFNGHMFPTKRTDDESRQVEHVLRHLRVLDATCGDASVAGCIGWCMADYNTHKDFGSGNRICHHGVLDMFRVPKFAAQAYASQCSPEDSVILVPVTYWTRGERNIGGVLPLVVLTNCDEVVLRIDGDRAIHAKPDRDMFPNLPHPPVIIDHSYFPASERGRWGMLWKGMTLTGMVGGQIVKTISMVGDPVATHLDITPDNLALIASEKDQVRIVVRALDQAGSLLPYLNDPLEISVHGPAILLGPSIRSFDGGTAAFWLESTGSSGKGEVRLKTERFSPACIAFSSERKPSDS